MLPFMPGQRAADKERAFFSIFSTIVGAIEIARMLPEPAMREKVLASARELLIFGVKLAVAQTPTQLPVPVNQETPFSSVVNRASHSSSYSNRSMASSSGRETGFPPTSAVIMSGN